MAVTAGAPRRMVADEQTHFVFGPEFHTCTSPDDGEFGILADEGRDNGGAAVVRVGGIV